MLEALRVIEIASESAAFAGKLMADLGAEVIVVEPPGGHHTRAYGPFADDAAGDPERSLWWWYYNTSKRSVTLDIASESGGAALARLIGQADLVLEGEAPSRLGTLDLDYPRFLADQPRLIWISVTPFGRRCPELDAPMTDLTILAGGGPVWNCGYDDHELPPVRGGGNQAFHIAGTFAVMAGLSAVLNRDVSGLGQHVDVSMHAAANVTTESGTFCWLVDHSTVQRQTGRHAATVATMPTQVLAADGKWVTTGFPPNAGKDFETLLGWLSQLQLTDEFLDTGLLQLGLERGGVDYHKIGSDVETTAIYGAGREALCFIASRLPAYDFFIGAQERDFQCGIVYAPEEAFADPHFVARGFPVPLAQPQLGRTVLYPGAPFKSSTDGWQIRRPAPSIGEHNDDLLGE
jgi:crotonobetainyl-CoA:carnitine CoA-transferase CaiB-like acyl-CoA transferase